MDIDDNDTNGIIIIKIVVVALTAIVMGATAIRQCLHILKLRNKKIGFTKDK